MKLCDLILLLQVIDRKGISHAEKRERAARVWDEYENPLCPTEEEHADDAEY